MIASQQLNNNVALIIHDITYGIKDHVLYSYELIGSEPRKPTYKAVLRYTTNGRAYIRARHGTVYMDECVNALS